MGAVMVNGKNLPAVESVEEMAGRFTSELMAAMGGWKHRLMSNPAELEQLERDVHAAFSRGADLVVAGLLAVVMKQPAFAASSEQTRKDYAHPLTRGRERTIGVKLLGGLLISPFRMHFHPRLYAVA